jgi:hypothetical protein
VLRRLARALALFALGCGSPQANEPKSAEAPGAASARASDDAPPIASESDPALLSGTPRRRTRFAASPITELSEKIAALVISVLEGRPPPNDLPLATLKPGTEPVEWRGVDREEVQHVDWFLVAPEIEFSVTVQDGTHKNVRSVYVLSEAGLHLIDVDVGNLERKQVVPDWARGLEAVAIDLLARARQGSIATLLPGDDLRRVIADDELWEEAKQGLAKAEKFAEVEAVARAATTGPTGFRLDDVSLGGRAPNGKIYSCKLEFDEQDGRIVMNPRMTVRAEK